MNKLAMVSFLALGMIESSIQAKEVEFRNESHLTLPPRDKCVNLSGIWEGQCITDENQTIEVYKDIDQLHCSTVNINVTTYSPNYIKMEQSNDKYGNGIRISKPEWSMDGNSLLIYHNYFSNKLTIPGFMYNRNINSFSIKNGQLVISNSSLAEEMYEGDVKTISKGSFNCVLDRKD